MKRLIQSYLLVLFLLLSVCAAPRQAFNKDMARDLRTVAVTDHAIDESFVVWERSKDGAPPIVVIFLLADYWAKNTRVTTALDPKQTRVQNRLSKRLAEGLTSYGYNAEVITLDQPAGLDDAFKLASQRSKADAVVAVDVVSRYQQASSKSDYVPLVAVRVKAFETNSGKVLYENGISYGYEYAGAYDPFRSVYAVHLASDPKYRFRSVDDIVKNAELAREGLLAGADAIAAQIAADLDPKGTE